MMFPYMELSGYLVVPLCILSSIAEFVGSLLEVLREMFGESLEPSLDERTEQWMVTQWVASIPTDADIHRQWVAAGRPDA